MQNPEQNKIYPNPFSLLASTFWCKQRKSNSTTRAASKMNKTKKNLGRKLVQKRLCAKSAKRDFL